MLVLLTTDSPSLLRAQPNRPPEVSIAWPKRGDAFTRDILIKIKAEAVDPDGSVAEVQFYAETNLIGVVTNPPFSVVWQVKLPGVNYGTINLKAVAVDNLGARTESGPVSVYYYIGGLPWAVLEIVSPRDGTMYAVPATFVFSSELLQSSGYTGPVEFFVGTNSVGLVDQGGTFSGTTPPASVTVGNLVEGEYKLTVRYRGIGAVDHPARLSTNTIRVVKLGVQLPSVTPDGRLQFEVVTSFPGRQTIIEASPNLVDWAPISTNEPSNNAFTFTDPTPATNSRRFYRVLVPPE